MIDIKTKSKRMLLNLDMVSSMRFMTYGERAAGAAAADALLTFCIEGSMVE